MKTVTLAISEDLLHQAETHARRRGISLNTLFCHALQRELEHTAPGDDLLNALHATQARSRGQRWSRDELHDRHSASAGRN